MMKWIPNSITLINLFLGSVAVVFVFEGLLAAAAIIIGVCSLLDFLDGVVARWLNARSPIGKQLDSLADLVSFGVAPASIMYHYLKNTTQTVTHQEALFVWPLIAFLIVVFSALRLAIFNTREQEEIHFTGLPTPANALLIASIPFVLAFVTPDKAVYQALDILTGNFWLTMALSLVVSFLLIAPLRMFSLKMKSLKWNENRVQFIYLAGCLVLLITFGLASLPLFLIFYIFLSIADHIWSISYYSTGL